MSKALAVINPAMIPSLPRQLEDLAAAIGTVQWPGQPTRMHIQTRPHGLTDQERQQVEALLSTLNSALAADAPFELDGQSFDGAMAKGALLTKMIRGLAGRAQVSDVEAVAKVEMYGDAIDDLPAWAIDKAIKRWARGNCPYTIEEKPNYNFPPAPGILRKMALFDMEQAQKDRRKLQNLLDCIVEKRALDPEPLPVTVGPSNLPALKRM